MLVRLSGRYRRFVERKIAPILIELLEDTMLNSVMAGYLFVIKGNR
jgi:hypothetical protein